MCIEFDTKKAYKMLELTHLFKLCYLLFCYNWDISILFDIKQIILLNYAMQIA